MQLGPSMDAFKTSFPQCAFAICIVALIKTSLNDCLHKIICFYCLYCANLEQWVITRLSEGSCCTSPLLLSSFTIQCVNALNKILLLYSDNDNYKNE